MPNIWATLDAGTAFRTPQLLSEADLSTLWLAGKERKKDAEGAEALDFKALVQGLPHIVLVVDGENRIIFANFAAEVFFGISEALLKKRALNSVLPYSNPLAALANQVRVTRGAVNEYEVDLGSPEIPYRAVDIFASLLAEDLDYVLVMVQQRSMAAHDRAPTHAPGRRPLGFRAWRRCWLMKSKIRFRAFAARRNSWRRAPPSEDRPLAQLITEETDRIRNLVDRMEVFGDERPVQKESVNIHTVLDHVRQIAANGFARHLTSRKATIQACRLCPAIATSSSRLSSISSKTAAEAIGDSRMATSCCRQRSGRA